MNRVIVVLTLLLAACSPSRGAHPATHATASPRPAPALRYLVVTRQSARTVRIIREPDNTGRDLEVGAWTQGAISDGHTAYLVAPDAGELVMVSKWPPVVRRVRGLKRPHDAAIAGKSVAVTEENANDLAIVDPATPRVSTRVALPGRPHNVVASTNGFIVTIPNRRSFVEVAGNKETREVALGERPHACVPFASAIWCVTYDAPHLLKIENGHVTERISLGVYPHHLTPSNEGTLFVSDPVGGAVSELDTSGKVLRRLTVPRAAHLLERSGELDVVSDAGSVYRFRNDVLRGRWSEPAMPHAIVEVASR